MEFNDLQSNKSWHSVRNPGGVPVFRAAGSRAVTILVAAVVGLMLLTVGCYEHRARTEVPMPSDPIPHIDEALLTGTWLLDGNYAQIEKTQRGFELRLKGVGHSGDDEVDILPFRLARLGDALFFEFEESATEAHPTFYWPCRIDIVDKALQLYCFYLDDLAEKRPDLQLRMKKFEDIEEVIDATSGEIRDLYTQLAFDPKIFALDMILKRPRPDVVARVQRHAAAGSADAQEQLALFYLNGDYVARDREEAERWLRRAADQGHAKAQYELGKLLLESSQSEQSDKEEILFWFRRSSERGYAPAFGATGLIYENGNGVPADPVHAIQWYQAGCEHSDDTSHYRLGMIQLKGELVQSDERQALDHFLAAAAINSKNGDYWEQIAALRLGATNQSLRNSALALNAAQHAIAMASDGFTSTATWSRRKELLAEALFRNGRYTAAVTTYREVMMLDRLTEDEEANRRLQQYESALPLGMAGAQ